MKVPDPRQAELTKEWCETLYQNKYLVRYMWSAKDAGLLKRLLGWADGAYGAEAKDKILAMMRDYLASTDVAMTSRHHPFSLLVSNPTRWVTPDVQKEEKRLYASDCPTCKNEGLLAYENLSYRCRCTAGDGYKKFAYAPEAAYVSKEYLSFTQELSVNPIQKLKGLKTYGWVLKKHHPEMYKRIAKELSEIIGRDRALAIWKGEEVSKVDQGAPLPPVREVERCDPGREPGDDSEPYPNVRSVDAGLQQRSPDVCGVPSDVRELVDSAKKIFGVSSAGVHTQVFRDEA